MPEQLVAALLIVSAGFAGLALGASGATVTQFAPHAFKRLDYTRADALVRRVLAAGLPWAGGFAAGGAAFALAGGALGSGALLTVAAIGIFVARYALNPLPKRPRTPGARRRYSRTRIAALQATMAFMAIFPFALIALAFGL